MNVSNDYQRRYGFVFKVVLSFLMSGVMSMVVTLMNLGYANGFYVSWFQAWALSVFIALPVLLLLTPVADLIARQVLPKNKQV